MVMAEYFHDCRMLTTNTTTLYSTQYILGWNTE
jgi:hypothetical protein